MNFALPWRTALLGLAFILFLWRSWSIGRELRRSSTLFLWKRLLAAHPADAKRKRRPPAEIVVEALLLAMIILFAAGPERIDSTRVGRTVIVSRGPLASAVARRSEIERLTAELAAEPGFATEIVEVSTVGPAAGAPTSFAAYDRAIRDARRSGRSIVLVGAAGSAAVADDVRLRSPKTAVFDFGLVSAAASADPANGAFSVFVVVARSRAPGPTKAALRIRAGIEKRVEIECPPGETRSVAVDFDAASADAHGVEIDLETPDDVSDDDHLRLVRSSEPGRALVEDGLDAFADALRALGWTVTEGAAGENASRDCDLRVARKSAAGSRAGIFILAESAGSWTLVDPKSATGPLRFPDAAVPQSPIEARRAIDLARSEAVGLGFVGADAVIAERQADRAIVLAFDPIALGWDRRATFPLFVRALVARVVDGTAGRRTFVPDRPGTAEEWAAAITEGREPDERAEAKSAPDAAARRASFDGPFIAAIVVLGSGLLILRFRTR